MAPMLLVRERRWGTAGPCQAPKVGADNGVGQGKPPCLFTSLLGIGLGHGGDGARHALQIVLREAKQFWGGRRKPLRLRLAVGQWSRHSRLGLNSGGGKLARDAADPLALGVAGNAD